MRIVHYLDLRGWTDGPKVVLDLMSCVDCEQLPAGVHCIAINSVEGAGQWINEFLKLSPVMTFFIAAPIEDVEQLAKSLPVATIHKLDVRGMHD